MIKPDDQLPSWVQSKISIISRELDDVYHHLDGLSIESETSDPKMSILNDEDDSEFNFDTKEDEDSSDDVELSSSDDVFLSFDEFEKNN
jgi:hypothetical protein